MDHGPGLLEPFLGQIRISVMGMGRILGVGSCALDLGSKVGGGGAFFATKRCLQLFVFEAAHKNSILLTFVNNALT